MKTRRLTFMAVMLAVSVVLNIVERTTMQALTQPIAVLLGPVVGAGGIRIGLANVVVMLLLYTYGTKDSFVLLLLRIMIVGQLAIGLFSVPFWTSLVGGILAFLLMILFKSLKGFSIISVSIMGAVGHVIGQIIVAILFFETIGIIAYMPFMLLIAIPAGIFTGRLTAVLLKTLKPIVEQQSYT